MDALKAPSCKKICFITFFQNLLPHQEHHTPRKRRVLKTFAILQESGIGHRHQIINSSYLTLNIWSPPQLLLQ